STTFGGAAGNASAGYVIPTTETVSGIPPGSAASILLRVIGSEARGQQDFGPYPVMLGGGTIMPPNLALGTSPLVLIIPEPSADVLIVLGIAVLRWFVRPQTRAAQTRGCADGSRQPTA